jgi:CRP-like cAMP-binding protein
MSSRFARYGSWLACCLSRGRHAPLSEGDVASLAAEIGERQVAGGVFVFRRGDPPAMIHVVREGCVELSRRVGNRRVTLQMLHPGDVFGDVPAFLGDPEPFDARALEDTTLLSIEVGALFELLQTRPKVARRWFVSLAERMAGLQDRLVDLLAGPLESQLASILVREADDEGVVKITQAHLAEMVGVQRSSAQRVLKTLEAAEMIALRYRKIDVLDPSGLLSLVDDAELAI